MKILVTGANGFIGKHMTQLLNKEGYDVLAFDIDTDPSLLNTYINSCDFIIHLAGINRPLTTEEFYDGNSNFTKKVIDLVKESHKNIPIILSSSIQASLNNDYGKSKKLAEDYLLESGLPVYVFRLSNVFGKWCRPNYNSACATFCYNIAHNLPIQIRDRDYIVHFNYVDDIVNTFLKCIKGDINPSKDILYVNPTYDVSLGNLADTLYRFKNDIESDTHLPKINNEFELKLFITFCDYLRDEKYTLNYASDNRGSFEEIYKNDTYGQISINIAYPGITKGGHYHKYKKEIFMTVIGDCLIRERNINTNELLTYTVNGKESKKIDMIPYYTHDIKNIGDIDSVTIMWIDHIYQEETADTYREPVDL